MEEFRALRERHPELRDAHLCEIARLIGVTESRRLVGRHVLAHADRQKPLPGAIAITGHWTKYGAVYAIPFELPAGARGREPARHRPLYLRRPPHAQRDEGDPALLRDRAKRRAARRRSRSSAAAASPRCRSSLLRERLRARGALVDYDF